MADSSIVVGFRRVFTIRKTDTLAIYATVSVYSLALKVDGAINFTEYYY